MAFSITHPLTIASPTPTFTPTLTTTPSSTPPTSTPSSTTTPPPPSSTPPPPPPPPPSSTPTNTDTNTDTNVNGSSISAPPPVTSSPLSTPTTSIMESTSVGTMSNGQAFTTVIQSTTIIQQPATITAPVNTATASKGSSNTGAIVGGVVGGVAGLAIVAFIVWLLLRKRRRHEEDFDGNFDPARVVSGHNNRLNLDDEAAAAAAAAVTPYPYQPEMAQHRPGGEQYTNHPNLAPAAVGEYSPYHTTQPSLPPGAQPSGRPAGLQQHGTNQPGYSSPTSDGGYTSSSHYPPTNSISTATTTAGIGGAMMGAYFGNGPSPGPSEIGSGSASGSGHQGGYGVYPGGTSGRSAKEREALGGRLAVSNAADEGIPTGGPSGAAFPHPQPFQQPYYGAGGPVATSPPPPSVGGVSTGGAGEKSGLGGAAATAPGPVRVHQDAGRVPIPDPDPEEIPPTYDSIPADERH